MKIRYNENRDLVEKIRAGVLKKGGYCPCRIEKTEENYCMCQEFRRRRSPTPTSRATATARRITRRSKRPQYHAREEWHCHNSRATDARRVALPHIPCMSSALIDKETEPSMALSVRIVRT